MMTRPRRWIPALAVLALAAGSLVGCAHKAASEEEGSGPSPDAVAEVTVVRVGRAEINQSLTLTGNIAAAPNRDVRVSSFVPGRITQLTVAEGDRVAAGQVLAKIDDRPYRDQFEQAEAAAAQARAGLENAKLARARNETLFSRGIAARKDLEDARTQESVALATVRQAEAALSLVQRQLARTEIRSPLAGTVIKRFASVGEQVDGTAGQPVVEVADPAEVELLANVPAQYLEKLRSGRTLALTAEVSPRHPLSGRVIAVSPAVDPATNVGLARIRLANRNGLLRLGMFLSAQVAIETHPDALVVPPQAIYRDLQGRARVFRVDGENATAVPVSVGIETPERVELLTGVREGETVILTGGYGLGEKSRVRVKSGTSP